MQARPNPNRRIFDRRVEKTEEWHSIKTVSSFPRRGFAQSGMATRRGFLQVKVSPAFAGILGRCRRAAAGGRAIPHPLPAWLHPGWVNGRGYS
jgi:hypothetical protein